MVCAGEGSGAFLVVWRWVVDCLAEEENATQLLRLSGKTFGVQTVSPRPNWSSFLAQKATASQ